MLNTIDRAATHEEWQRTIVELAQLHDWWLMHVRKAVGKGGRHTTPTSIPGWPDLFLWHEERGPLAVEVKTEKDRLTKDQRDVLRSLNEAGVPAAVWRPSDWDEVVAVLGSARMTCMGCSRPELGEQPESFR